MTLFVLSLLVIAVVYAASLNVSVRSNFIKDGKTVENAVTITGSSFREIEEAVAANQTDKQVNISFTHADLLWIHLESDQDCTIETNATDATGGQTITLKAGIPFVWQKNSGITKPITADVTRFFVTNTTAIARLYCAVLNDATP